MNVSEIAKAAPSQGGVEAWTDLESGKSVVFTRKGTGKDNTKFYGHRLVDRRIPLTDEVINQTIDCLDDYIHMHPSYDEISETFYGGQPEEGAVDQPLDTSDPPSQQEGSDCPVRANFGEDFNKYEECDECPVYDDCKAGRLLCGEDKQRCAELMVKFMEDFQKGVEKAKKNINKLNFIKF